MDFFHVGVVTPVWLPNFLLMSVTLLKMHSIERTGPMQILPPPQHPAAAPHATPASGADPKQDALWKAAQSFEAAFLAQMLTAAGLGRQENSMGGGAGEDQFASFLVEAQAERMVEAGGIGLAENIFESLKEQANDG